MFIQREESDVEEAVNQESGEGQVIEGTLKITQVGRARLVKSLAGST